MQRREFEPVTVDDLDRIYVVVPRDDGHGTVNLTISQLSDRQFRTWAKAKADLAGVRMITPIGRIGVQTRVYMLNRLIQSGVPIYRLASLTDSPPR